MCFPSKGVKVGRRVGRRKIVPYYDRGEIEDGALDGWHLEICWLRSQIDVLFAQIQGSARIRLEDGTILRVNYDSHNGWPYTPVGRVLIERKLVPKDEMSMQRIRQWMDANPDAAKDVRRQNKSYVFFRITDLSTEDEAIGAQGVPLVPGRSIAVDRSLHAYGTPFFIAADLPIANEKAGTKFRRLMFAQDTGSAIVGPARADIYFGAGDEAARIAGRIRHPGQFVMLLPRELDPVEAAADVPLPPERQTGFFAQFNAGDMIDPTAEEVPLPEAKPAIEPDQKAIAAAKTMTRRRPLSDEERALWTGFARSIKPLTVARTKRTAEPPASGRRSEARASAARRRRVQRRTSTAEKAAAARAARPAAQETRGPRTRANRCPARSARLHANAGACGAVALSAACAGRRRQDRARRHRQRNGQGADRPEARWSGACSSGRCRSGFRCRSFGLSSSASRMRISVMAGRAHCMSGCGARARAVVLTLTIGISERIQKPPRKSAKIALLVWSICVMSEMHRTRYPAKAHVDARRYRRQASLRSS